MGCRGMQFFPRSKRDFTADVATPVANKKIFVPMLSILPGPARIRGVETRDSDREDQIVRTT